MATSRDRMTPLFRNYGIGVGLRGPYVSRFVDPASRPANVQWIEAISDNYLPRPRFQNTGAKQLLLQVRRDYPVALHGVSLSLGAATGVNLDYLRRLKSLVQEIDPIVVSDHVCWTRVGSRQTFDLNPIPYTRLQAEFVARQIRQVQEVLGRRILIENVSSYLDWKHSEMSEAEFLREVLERADCGLLLDLNNVYVSATNHGFDARKYLETLPAHRVGQLHLAGHEAEDGLLIDTHGAPVSEEVWELYRWYGRTRGHASAMVERDANLPDWSEIESELACLAADFRPNQAICDSGLNPSTEIWSSTVFGAERAPTPELAAEIERARELQHQWVDSLLGEVTITATAGDERLSAATRFEVYEQAFWTRVNSFIATDFVQFRKRVGEESFDSLVQEIIRATPPEEESFYEVSALFLGGLRRSEHPDLPTAEADWARTLARLDRAQALPAGVQPDLQKLGEENPEDFGRIRVILHPSLKVLPDQRAIYWYQSKPHERRLNEEEWAGLQALRSGLPLSEWQGVTGLHAENVRVWAQEGIICGYEKISKSPSA